MLFLFFAFVATISGTIALWPSSTAKHIPEELSIVASSAHHQVSGTVQSVQPGGCNNPDVGRTFEISPHADVSSSDTETPQCTHAIVNLTSGTNAGLRTLLLLSGKPGDPDLHEGDAIRLSETESADGTLGYAFADYQRVVAMIVVGLIVSAAILLVGGRRGLRALCGVVVAVGVVILFLLPALLDGENPIILAILVGSMILFPVVFLVHGVTWKSAAALAGTLLSAVIAALLAWLALGGTHVRGLGDDDNLLIHMYFPDVSVQGLMLCGFIIGSLGVLNDVTVTQASTVTQLAELNPTAHRHEWFCRAMHVGQDHIGSMVYTLVLSYTGAALPLLLLLSVSGRSLVDTLFSDIMVVELLRSGVGAVALCLAVPMTTGLAALCAPRAPLAAGEVPQEFQENIVYVH